MSSVNGCQLRAFVLGGALSFTPLDLVLTETHAPKAAAPIPGHERYLSYGPTSLPHHLYSPGPDCAALDQNFAVCSRCGFVMFVSSLTIAAKYGAGHGPDDIPTAVLYSHSPQAISRTRHNPVIQCQITRALHLLAVLADSSRVCSWRSCLTSVVFCSHVNRICFRCVDVFKCCSVILLL